MGDLSPRSGGVPSRRSREQRAFRLVLAGGAAGLVAAVGLVLAIVGIIGYGIPVLALVVAVICLILFRRTIS
jgi:ABC-type bacteriocin/lantibiotic exporter with double-glycine peptidase domain